MEILNRVRQKYIYVSKCLWFRLLSSLAKDHIYHYHIRKTAGTSINFAFLREVAPDETESFYGEIAKASPHCKVKKKKVFVGWNTSLINKGNYYYAWSHTPAHKLNLPSNVQTITCFRDPVKRVLSLYNMLSYYKKEKIKHPCMAEQGKWLGDCFKYFINRIPKEHLLNQLYMFSEKFDIEEAIDFLSERKTFIMFTETLTENMAELGAKIDKQFSLSREKEYGHKEAVTDDDWVLLKSKLAEEYKFMKKLKELKYK